MNSLKIKLSNCKLGKRNLQYVLQVMFVLAFNIVFIGATTAAGSDNPGTDAGLSAASPIINTKVGPMQGENINGVNRFLGIPYAQSISGINRFAPPQPVDPWTKVRLATRYANSSPQHLLHQHLIRQHMLKLAMIAWH